MRRPPKDGEKIRFWKSRRRRKQPAGGSGRLRKVAVVHIGTHKTGSKSLQSMLHDNPRWFEEQGLTYPMAGRFREGHHNLAWELSGDQRFDPAVGALADVVEEVSARGADFVFLSSEDFECIYPRRRALEKLRSSLSSAGYEGHVVVTLREPADYMESLYSELRSKHEYAESLAAFVSGALNEGAVRFRDWDLSLDYNRLVSGFRDVFGAKAVHLLRYERADSVGPVFEACGRLWGRPLRPVPGWGRHNVRQPHPAPDPSRSGASSEQPDVLTETQRRLVTAAFHRAFEDLCPRDRRSEKCQA